MVIEGIKLIKHTGECDRPDDTSYPWKLEANLRPPQFMVVAFVGIYGGSEDIVLRGMTKEAIDAFLEKNELRSHPRLRKMTLTGPDGVPHDITKGDPSIPVENGPGASVS